MPSGVTPKLLLVVGDAPADLRDAVARAGQRHDHVVVNLRHGRAVAADSRWRLRRLAVQDHAIGARRVFFEPAQQRGAEVEADARVVVDDARDLVFGVDHARRAVGGVALRADALVPVVVRAQRSPGSRRSPARGSRAAAGRSDRECRRNACSLGA